MTNDEIATEHAKAMLQREIDYCMKERPDRIARFTPEERAKMEAEFIEKQKAEALKRIGEFESQDGLLKMHRIAALHPSNKNTRKMFEQWSGKKLPKSPTETERWLREFIGPDIVDAYYAKREADAAAEQAAKDAEEARKHAEAMAKLKGRVIANEPIGGGDLVDLARSLNIEVHPRTAGMCFKRIRTIQKDTATVTGKGDAGQAHDIYRQILAAVSK